MKYLKNILKYTHRQNKKEASFYQLSSNLILRKSDKSGRKSRRWVLLKRLSVLDVENEKSSIKIENIAK